MNNIYIKNEENQEIKKQLKKLLYKKIRFGLYTTVVVLVCMYAIGMRWHIRQMFSLSEYEKKDAKSIIEKYGLPTKITTDSPDMTKHILRIFQKNKVCASEYWYTPIINFPYRVDYVFCLDEDNISFTGTEIKEQQK